MKNLLLPVLALMLSSSLASACIGGGMIQVIDKDDAGVETVVANYDNHTGKMTSRNRSIQITSVKINRIKNSNLCVDAGCSQLKEVENKNIKFSYENMEGVENSVVIRNVTISANAPRPRGMLPSDATPKDSGDDVQVSDNLQILPCSQK